jgi:hypothetical protein
VPYCHDLIKNYLRSDLHVFMFEEPHDNPTTIAERAVSDNVTRLVRFEFLDPPIAISMRRCPMDWT